MVKPRRKGHTKRVAGKPPATRTARQWEYDAGQPWQRRKHGWAEPHAGFVQRAREIVGKCPAGMNRQQAEQILNSSMDSPDCAESVRL